MSNQLAVNFIDENNVSGSGRLDKLPDECPVCHRKINPIKDSGFLNTNPKDQYKALEVIFRCPDSDCREVFIGYYSKRIDGNDFYLKEIKPKSFSEKEFSETINKISDGFVKIYNQALSAEKSGLDQICGAGYRRALEFLIKDYLLQQTEDGNEKEKIKNEYLGTCIKNRIKDTNIKEVAKRAAWLGNDETHYLRKWEQKDLQDLKKLIDLTVHWIEAETLTNQLLEDMPELSQ